MLDSSMLKPVTGHPLPCGHFIPEEAPEALAAALAEFLTTI